MSLDSDSLPVIHDDTGVPRVLGLLPPRWGNSLPDYAVEFGLLDRSLWRETTDFAAEVVSVMDQGATSRCGGYAVAGAAMRAWLHSGQPKQQFSPNWPYGLTTNKDAGVVLTDLLETVEQYGFARDVDVGGALWRSQFPSAAFEVAKRRFRFKFYRTPNFDAMCSALSRGHPVVFGIPVGQNFGRLDSEGVCPLPDRVLGGHAMAMVRLTRSSRFGWAPTFVNSWRPEWGEGGYGKVHEGHFRGFCDGFAVVAARDDPEQDATDPPPVVLTPKTFSVAVSPQQTGRIVEVFGMADQQSTVQELELMARNLVQAEEVGALDGRLLSDLFNRILQVLPPEKVAEFLTMALRPMVKSLPPWAKTFLIALGEAAKE